MASTPNSVDRVESAADISLQVSKGATAQGGLSYAEGGPRGRSDAEADARFIEVPISRLDTTKDVSIEEVRESSVKASGFAITAISYSGTMMFKGSRKTKVAEDGSKVYLDDILYDDHGVPVSVSISITHELLADDDPQKTETYETVLVTSESYEVRSEETTEQAYDWIAMDRTSDQPDGNG